MPLSRDNPKLPVSTTMTPIVQTYQPRRLISYIQIFLLVLCTVAMAADVPAPKAPKAPQPAPKEDDKPKAAAAPAGADADGEGGGPAIPKVWGDVFSLPPEGYEIVGKLKPPPCRILSIPSIIVPAADM